MTSPISGSMSAALGKIAADSKETFTVFNTKATSLPSHLSLEGLVSWLSAKMNDTDEEIKKHMSEINDQKNAEAKLHDLIAQLQGCVKKGATDGMVDIPTDLTDEKKVHDSALYQSLDSDGKKAIDDMLDKVKQDFVVKADVTLDGFELKAGDVIHDLHSLMGFRKIGLKDSDVEAKGTPRMSNDDLETSIKSLTETASAISSNDEVNMIGLQTQISARAQLVQLVSNMISSVTDTNRSIIQNCKV